MTYGKITKTSNLQDLYLQFCYLASRWQFALVFSHYTQALLQRENQTIELCKSVLNYWPAHTNTCISGYTLFISDYFGYYWCVRVNVCVCLTLAASSHAVVRRHHHAACCCPFSGLVPLIITTQVAAHQSSPHHVHLLQTQCLQHPTGTTSSPPCKGGGLFHSCIVIFCCVACIAPLYSLLVLSRDAPNAAQMQLDALI